MTSRVIWVDEITDVLTSIKRSLKTKKIWKNSFLNKFYIILHFLSLCVFISIQNIGWSIPLISIWPTFSSCNQKHVGWFLLRSFLNLVRVWSLHIISRSHPNTFLLAMSVKKSGYIFSVVSGEFPFTATCSEKKRPEKFPFKVTNNWIVLAVRQSLNYFFALNSLIFRKSLAEQKETGNFNTFCFTSKRKIVKNFMFYWCSTGPLFKKK